MMLAETTSTGLRWHSLPPLWVVVLLVIPAVLLAVRFIYRREAGRVGRQPRRFMGALRALAILLVLGALFGPYAETVEGVYAKRHLVLLVDTSSSMSIRDSYRHSDTLAAELRRLLALPGDPPLESKTRLEIARAAIGSDPAFLEKLAEKFRLQVYTFDSDLAGAFLQNEEETPAEAAARLQRLLPHLKAEGTVTRIGVAIRDLVRRLEARNEPVAGVFLFSDGRHTGGAPSPIEEARFAATRGESVTIFPVAIGDPAAAVNVGVSRVEAPEVVLAGDTVTFTVSVHARGLEGRGAELEALVVDPAGVEEPEPLPIVAEFDLPGDDVPARKVFFRHRFDEHGTYQLRIGVPPLTGETVEGDNYKTHVLSVVKLKMRVLFVVSKPNYTYRFLKEALFRAENTIEACVLNLDAEPQWPQESSRGVAPTDEFPREKSDLAPFDVVILNDVNPEDHRFARGEPSTLQETLGVLESWVKDGGGLILQAGRALNLTMYYDGTPMLALMPVVPHSLVADHDALVQTEFFKYFRLTPAGLANPILRILQDPEKVKEFWESGYYDTEYYWYAPVARAKSSAHVLAVRRDGSGKTFVDADGRPHPLIALQDYGLGKVLWLGTDEFWRMRRGHENLYYWRFWQNAIRYLATYRLLGGNKRIKIWVDRADGRYHVDDTIGIEAKFLDEDFEPVRADDEAGRKRVLKLYPPDGPTEDVTVHFDPTEEGLFRTKLLARRPGTYRLEAESDLDEEPAKATFVVEETTIEKRDPLMDRRTLQAIADANGHRRVLQPPEFRRLIEDRIVPPTGAIRSGEPLRTDLWDRAWVLWLFVGLLAVEWILRRLNLLL